MLNETINVTSDTLVQPPFLLPVNRNDRRTIPELAAAIRANGDPGNISASI